MSDLFEEETDIGDSELEEYADLCYEKLSDGHLTVKVSENEYRCPYCFGKEKTYYWCEDLLQHASALSQGSTKRKPRDRGKHLGLLKYVRNVLKAARYDSKAWMVMDEDDDDGSRNLNELYVWPWMGIVANIPVRLENGRFVGKSGSIIRDDLIKKGFNPVRVHPIWSFRGHSGYAIVEFRSEMLGYYDATRFEKAYEALHQGKRDYFGLRDKGDKLYCWVAREDEFRMENAVGDHIRKKGNLKTVAQYQEEEARKYCSLKSHLAGTIQVKNMQIIEIETKYKQTDITLCKLIDQTDEMIRDFNEEREKVQQDARRHLERISLDHERMRLELEGKRSELKKLEEELEKREAHNEMERLMLKQQQNERAILEQKRQDEKVLKLAEDHKREQEELNRKVIELEKQLDAKQAVVLEIQRLRGNVKVAMHMEDAGDENGAQYISKLQEELKLKEEELEDLEALNQALVIKELKCNDELQDARMALVKGFDGVPSRALIGVKRIGELDGKVFAAAAKRKHPKDSDLMGARLYSLWESYLKDPNWNPFSKCLVEGNSDQYKTIIINEEDEKLLKLRNEYGDEPYEAVKAALLEIGQHKLQNLSGGYSMLELWNNKDERRATTNEGISYLIRQWGSLKKKR